MRLASHRLAWFLARFALFVIAVAGLGCAGPAPLVGLVPRNPAQAEWVNGRSQIAKAEGGVRVAVAFESQRGDLSGALGQEGNACRIRYAGMNCGHCGSWPESKNPRAPVCVHQRTLCAVPLPGLRGCWSAQAKPRSWASKSIHIC